MDGLCGVKAQKDLMHASLATSNLSQRTAAVEAAVLYYYYYSEKMDCFTPCHGAFSIFQSSPYAVKIMICCCWYGGGLD